MSTQDHGTRTRHPADVVGENVATGERIIVQIGKMSKTIPDLPIVREGEAIADIFTSPDFDRAKDLLIFWEKGVF